MLRFDPPFTFLEGLALADECSADPLCVGDALHLSSLLLRMAHALWEPQRMTHDHIADLQAVISESRFFITLEGAGPMATFARLTPALQLSTTQSNDLTISRLVSAIIHCTIEYAHSEEDARRCVECATWFSAPTRSGRSKFCSRRCRNAFNYRRRISNTQYRCAGCSRTFTVGNITGLYFEPQDGCVMGSAQEPERLLCEVCAASVGKMWRRYALGEPRKGT